MKGTRTYAAWRNMKERCKPTSKKHRARYHDRGIAVCERWSESFENFLADMGECPPDLQLDRIDNDRGYEPGNCRWATRAQQQSNLGCNRWIAFDGKTLTIRQWSRKLGIKPSTLTERLGRYGWTVEQALSRVVPRKGVRP
jgi:hypothetical protein